jgi:hypothetical protein
MFGLLDYSIIALVKYGGIVIITWFLWSALNGTIGRWWGRP